MLKIGKEKLSLFFALAFMLFSFPITSLAEGQSAPQGKGEIIEYDLNPESTTANEASSESQGYTKGASLGTFQLVGYSGDGMTYSGAPTKANHTVAADLKVLPLGTKISVPELREKWWIFIFPLWRKQERLPVPEECTVKSMLLCRRVSRINFTGV